MNKFFRMLLPKRFKVNNMSNDQKEFKRELNKIIVKEGFINISDRDINSFIASLKDIGLFKKEVVLIHMSSLSKFDRNANLILVRLKMTGEAYLVYKIKDNINKDINYVEFNITFLKKKEKKNGNVEKNSKWTRYGIDTTN